MKTSPLGATVLVVEDDPRLNFFLCSCLANAGYHVVSADGCLGALALLDAGELPRVDILLTEAKTSVFRGSEFLRWVRRSHPYVRCIVMSRERPKSAPENWTWLPKPVEQETLVQTVDCLREPARAAA